jgi:predicted NBD/HSP70 family sugar kinase
MLVTVDTGGTKTLVASFSEDGKIVRSVRFPTPQNQDDYIRELVHTLKTDFSDTTIDALSVAVPGIIIDGVAVMSTNLAWRNLDLVKQLGDIFSCPVLLANDSKMAGLGEANALVPVPRLCLYVTVSTGIGTAFLENGRLIPSLNGSEAGHMVLEHDGVMKSWESFASGKAIYNAHGKYASEITSKRAWDHIGRNIALGLQVLIPTFVPDAVIIGGSIGTYFDQYATHLTGLIKERLPAVIKCPTIQQAQHPEEAVIYGCYYNAVHQLNS